MNPSDKNKNIYRAVQIADMLRRSPGGDITLLGLGVSNLPLAHLLIKLGYGPRLVIRDGKDAAALGQSATDLANSGARLYLGSDPVSGLCREREMTGDIIFRSPGIRPDAGDLPAATARGAYLTSETEWFCAATPATVFAVTGSDGKTTTTTLTGMMLDRSPRRGNVLIGGNIGTPLLDRVDDMSSDDAAVLELSSFQLQTMSGPARRAAITNITPNHLNWHTDMDEYTRAKYNVFGDSTELLVLNAGNSLSRSAADIYDGSVTYFSFDSDAALAARRARPGSAAIFPREGHVIFLDADGYEDDVLDISSIRLPGKHNVENYMTAVALTRGYASPDVIRDIAASFGGVEHRLEFVRELDGVRYYNSSIDSSPSRTVAALSTFSCRPVLICGGRDKHVPFDTLAAALVSSASAVVLTGEAMWQIKDAIDRVRASGASDGLTVLTEPDFDTAIEKARSLAAPGSAVLLSPACTSFDRFSNFEERGNHFKDTVNRMKSRM